ncbi:rhomboid-domain-containing protein [Lepidopterella palustris CBS 459.81]|uniref:Rhomboid-domain-containing protein n=1 Tax=Lepidopterella palustris CBS 459.81 TaxID=1314670 RepID=A0A8E2EEA1_9PEZI|nr:rhomboid-domain-containing protein [Lepidopterella palustris CBS 459.81]
MSFFLGCRSPVFRRFPLHAVRGVSRSARSAPCRVTPNTTPAGGRPLSTNSSYYNPADAMKVLWGIVGANTAVFVAYQYSAPPAVSLVPTQNLALFQGILNNFIISLDSIRAGKYWTVLTSAFMHMQPMHIIGNLISMYAFGTVIISVSPITAAEMAILALGSAIAGNAGFIVHQSHSEVPGQNVGGLGASGVVMGMGGAAVCLFPRAKLLLYGVAPVPLWAIIGVYFAIDSYYLNQKGSRVSHSGHLGGLAFGFLYYLVRLRRYGGIASFKRFKMR